MAKRGKQAAPKITANELILVRLIKMTLAKKVKWQFKVGVFNILNFKTETGGFIFSLTYDPGEGYSLSCYEAGKGMPGITTKNLDGSENRGPEVHTIYGLNILKPMTNLFELAKNQCTDEWNAYCKREQIQSQENERRAQDLIKEKEAKGKSILQNLTK